MSIEKTFTTAVAKLAAAIDEPKKAIAVIALVFLVGTIIFIISGPENIRIWSFSICAVVVCVSMFGIIYLTRHEQLAKGPSAAITSVDKKYLDTNHFLRGMETLLTVAREFDPDHIVGINRGGAIVGGCIAKRLHIPVRGKSSFFLVQIWRSLVDGDPGIFIQKNDDIPILEGQRILIVDDSIRSAENMSLTINEIKRNYPGTLIEKIVLLDCLPKDVGPGGPMCREIEVISAFQTSLGDLFWFWDPDLADDTLATTKSESVLGQDQ